MLEFSEYTSEEFKELPIDFGRKILKLNWVLSSGMLDEYIYENKEGQLFYVKGVYQAFCLGEMTPQTNENNRYHMALIIPVKTREKLVEFLEGKIPLKNALHQSSFSYLLALKPNFYYDERKNMHISMHPIKDNKELTRKKESELHEFEFIKGKKCPTKSLPSLYNPNMFWWEYKLGKKLSFIFISEDEKKDIYDFIKKYKK